MEETLRHILSVTIGMLCALFGAGCLPILAIRFWRWVPMVGLWRLKRQTIVVLFVLSVIATIEAQKRTGGEGTSGSQSSQMVPDSGEAEPPPLRDAPTNTLHFAAISTGTNEVTLTLAWPPELFASGTVLDLFAATSLVETVWDWQCAHTVAEGETNWMTTVGYDGSARFFCATERADPGDMRDTDGDGIPDVYELHNGTNPYVPDYAAAPKLTVGPSGAFGTVGAAVEASVAYSIIELDPSMRHEIDGMGLGCMIPVHPIMVTAPRPYAVVRSAELSAFNLATNTTEQTLFRNLYLLLDAKDSFQTGFWCGGNLPWSGVPASATFRNIYVRMPNPGVQYRGWLLYARCAERVSILGCTLNAAGATWAVGIDAYDSPPITMDGCSFVNFPPDCADGTSCGILLRTSSLGGGTDVTLSRTLFDESFIDAWPLGRFDSASPCSVSASGCILPCQFPMEYPPDAVTNLTVTNAALAWVGVPHPDSPSVALGVGSLAPIVNDPTVDTDGDGLADYDEAYDHGTDPYLADSDNDGEMDWSEIHNGTDPTDPHSFTQALTVTVTNTVSVMHSVHVAWGNSVTGWETNGLASFPGGSGTTTYTNASALGAAYVKAFCDLNGDGEYDSDQDILLVREIPYGSTAQINFTFGDVDGDGVSDAQERADGTDPYDKKSFRMSVMVKVTNEDNVQSITNFLSWGNSSTGWGTNGLVSFAKLDVQPRSMFISDVVTNGNIYVKCYRDLNRNGAYDSGEDALYVKQVGSGYNGGEYSFAIGDFDGDEIPDSVELDEGTDPFNGRSYCFSMSATVTGIFHTTNQLMLAATFGDTVLCGPVMMTTNIWSADFGHLLATNGEKVVLTFWDDANSNGIHDVSEAFSQRSLPVTNHSNICTLKLPYGGFDADGNNLPDWWEVVTGLAECTGPHGEFDDADGDGLINLHEYWAGCDPLVPDGSNTLLSVMARSIDERIKGKTASPTTKARFLNYPVDSVSSGFQPNTNCWAYGIDLSCASPWNSWRGSIQAGTAITKRHLLFAKHYLWSSNGEIYFHDANGNIHTNRLIDRNFSLQTDIAIGLLQSDLTDSVHTARILPPSCESVIGDGRGLPVLSLDQEEHVLVHDIGHLDENVNGIYPVSSNRYEFAETVIVGDSGNPRFLVVSNEVILLNAFYGGGAGSGPSISFYKAHVQQLMDELSLSHGLDTNLYQLVEFPIE